jgi:transglutaminase-like putative cysteine protease
VNAVRSLLPAVRRLLPGIVLYAAMAGFAIWHLRLIERPSLTGLGGWAAFAALPALIAALPGRAGAGRRLALTLVPFVVIAIGLATGHWPFHPHLLGHTGYFARVGGDIHSGLSSWLVTVLPYDASHTPELRVIVLLGVGALLAALAAAILVWEAPLPAIVLAFVPFLVVSTVFRLEAPVLRAAIMLALAVAALAILGGRGSWWAHAAAGALVVLAATAVVGVPGVAKGEFVDWRHIGDKPKGTTMGFIWNQAYGPLVRPSKPVQLLRVAASRPSYWRVTVLDEFDGIKWVETRNLATPAAPPTVVVPADRLSPDTVARQRKDRLTARFTNLGWSTNALSAPPVTLALRGLGGEVGGVQVTTFGTVLTEHSPSVGSSWSVDYVPPRPTLNDLVNQSAKYPATVDGDLQLTNANVQFPPWGAPGREATVRDELAQYFFGPSLEGWKRVYDVARRVTRNAESPYEAAAAIEKYLHDNSTYDEKADYSQAPAPLPAFFFSPDRAGYCQMFSGTMAVMLRMLGIPARVAEGFTTGSRSSGSTSYLVTDRDAHAWVEAYFPRYGWLPFEPTPTRALPYSYSTTSPDLSKVFAAETKQSASNTKLDHLEQGLGIAKAAGPVGGSPHGGQGTRNEREGASAAGPAPGRHWHPGFITYLLGLLVAGVLALVLVKEVRSLRVYVRRSPEAIAAAVRSDLEAYVRDQGVSGSVRALTPTEFGRMLRREFGVDAHRWADVQSRARYGPPDGRAYEMARQARREARAVKRQLRKGLGGADRLRGAIRVRSLFP